MKSMTASIESLIQQRAQLGTHISQLEAQIEELKKNNRASCAKTVKQHEDDLKVVKQEIAGLVAKEKAEAVQKATEQKVPAPGLRRPPLPLRPLQLFPLLPREKQDEAARPRIASR